jgi:hypothetical protein
MALEISKKDRRIRVTANYLCVAVIACLVHVGDVMNWDLTLRLAGILVALAIGIVTFIGVFWKTRLWQVAHASFDKLDERQVQVVYESLRHSYRAFALVCLVVIYVNAVAGRGHVPILVAASVLYLAHTLPAAIMAWTEKEILVGGEQSDP